MILAVITVMQCEDCPTTRVLQHVSEYEQIAETWHNGSKYHFCPRCRFRPQAEDRIAEDALAATRFTLNAPETFRYGFVD